MATCEQPQSEPHGSHGHTPIRNPAASPKSTPLGSQAWLAILSVPSLSHPVSSLFSAIIMQNCFWSFVTMHPDLELTSVWTLDPYKLTSFIREMVPRKQYLLYYFLPVLWCALLHHTRYAGIVQHGTHKVKVKVTQLCPTLCDSMEYEVHGILQPRILEWVTCPFSRGSSQPRDWTQVSRIAGRVFTSGTTREAQERIPEWVAYPFSSGSSWSRNQSGVSCIAGRFFTSWATGEAEEAPYSKYIPHVRLALLSLLCYMAQIAG